MRVSGLNGSFACAAVLLVLLGATPAAMAQAQPPKAGAERTLTQADYAQLQAQINEQKQLLIRVLEAQRQNLDALIRMVSEGKAGAELPASAAPAARAAAASESGRRGHGTRAAPPVPLRGTVAGKVSIPGADPGSVVVFIQDVEARGTGGVVEMKQLNKQFVPGTLVVTRGTRVSFPNLDPIFHNVFSLTPGNSFDLGNYRKGDEAKTVLMAKSGVVKVYCNMHPQMVGHILVVPSHLYTKAERAGSFRISGVPTGTHRIAAWAPNSELVVQEVEVTSGGTASVDFSLIHKKAEPHTRKTGEPYGSYDE